jgi:hypothetical protein
MMGTKFRDDNAPALGKKGILAFKFPPLWRAPGGRPHQVVPPVLKPQPGYAVQDVEGHAFQHHAARFLDLGIAFGKTTLRGSKLFEAPLQGLDDESQILIGDAQWRCHD